MSRRNIVTAALVILAVLGAFGTFQIPGVRLELPWQIAILGVVVVAVTLVALSGFPESPRLPFHHKSLEENRNRRLPVLRYREKSLEVLVAADGSERRNGEFFWTLLVENPSRHSVAELRMAVVGEVALRTGGLVPTAAVGTGEYEPVRIEMADPHSPTIIVAFSAPGLPPRSVETVRVRYRWPGIVSVPDDTWVLDLTNVAIGGKCSISLWFPKPDVVTGHAVLVREWLGLRQFRPVGGASHRDEVESRLVYFTYIRRRRADKHVYLYTSAPRM